MFCRRCYYDLRGQQTPRCPECGTAFAFDDPDSFLQNKPGRLGRILIRLRRRRRILIAALTVLLLLCSYVDSALPLAHLRGGRTGRLLSMDNLKSVMTKWTLQQYYNPGRTEFDMAVARRGMYPSFSPWREDDAAWWNEFLVQALRLAPSFVVPTLVYLGLIAVLVGRRARRRIVVLVAVLLCVGAASLRPRGTASWLLPESYRFLDDVVFLPGVDLMKEGPQRGRNIAAYDVWSFHQGDQRVIAFDDGHVEAVPDDRARRLFKAQGIPYPGSRE